MSELEKLLQENYAPLERFIHFKIGNRHDADDLLQEVCLAATKKFDSLKDKSVFKAWLIGIAKHKCNDYYRKKSAHPHVSLDALPETALVMGRAGITVQSVVRDTLELLPEKEKEILYLYFFLDLSHDEIARRLSVPLGTVKSRLHYAKEKFRQHYPYKETQKGDHDMKTLPVYIPDYKIEKSDLAPFSVKWEETMGWFVVPKLGETIKWAMYDFPAKKRTELCEMEVVGKAEVHGIEGVEIVAIETDPMGCNSAGGQKKVERRFIAQLTDTHCRILAESHMENGVKHYYTFLDGEDFLGNWGFGEDNCGNEIHITAKGDITRDGDSITAKEQDFLLDIVGRYNVTIGGKTYDTVCVVDCYTYIDGAITEQYLDKNGRTVLWRRFNRNDWAFPRYQKLWTEMLPDNERLTVNGETYVHWYDCITDYIL
ncbi:MAG: RNA polymerase sigma factor [Clostridia bacterium]|nr:RNA polymerase sigma factor [Clostridia bacterium]